MNFVRSNNVSLKYQRPTPSGRKDIGIRKFDFMTKTQFLSWKKEEIKPILFSLILRFKGRNWLGIVVELRV